MFIFFRSSRTLCHSLHHGPIFIISVCSFYITTGRFMMMLWVFCGLYSPTWIFDFEGLRRVVMMIVCSEFFSKRSIKSYITNQQNKMYKDTLVRIFLFCFFFFYSCAVACIHRREYLTLRLCRSRGDDDCVLRIFFSFWCSSCIQEDCVII